MTTKLDPSQILAAVYDPATGALRISGGGGGGGGGATTFTGLTDTPASYSGAANKLVAVNGAGTALTFITAPAGNFIGLTDTPASYSGQGGKSVRVKSDATGLEFYTVPTYLTAVSGDTAPSLSGDLNVNGHKITGAAGVEIATPTLALTNAGADITLQKGDAGKLTVSTLDGIVLDPAGNNVAIGGFLTGTNGQNLSIQGDAGAVVIGGGTTTSLLVTGTDLLLDPSYALSVDGVNADLTLRPAGTGKVVLDGPVQVKGKFTVANTAGTISRDVRILSATTTTGSLTALTGATLAIATNTVVDFEIRVKGHRSDVFGEVAKYKLSFTVKNASGSLTIGPILKTIVQEDDSTWDADVAVSGTNIVINVTGASGKTIQWVAVVDQVV
ncbi:hypothetical protein [Azospirillum sp. sgz301742]